MFPILRNQTASQLTYGGEHCGGVVKRSSKLPGHSSFVRPVEENHLLEETEVVL